MCTQQLKCYQLSKEKLREYVEKNKLYHYNSKDIKEIENIDIAKAKAINQKTINLWYEKEDTRYKLKRICWKRPKQFIECYELSTINCGKCQECKFQKASEWALRCELETMYHEDNCFITLTYSNNNLPTKRSLKIKDLQDFWKRLRSYIARQEGKKNYVGPIGRKIKYFACGEYGPNTRRPHYHAIIFGWKPSDLEFKGMNRNGNKLFISEELAKIWGKGYVIIGEDASRNTAQYVAQYVSKKLGKEENQKHGRENEFITMSRKEAIGKKYLFDNFEKIWENKGIWIATKEGGKLKPIPKYFNKIYQQYYNECQRLDIDNYKLLNEYEENQKQKKELKLEKMGKILKETSLKEYEYIEQHANILKTRLSVFKREDGENEEEKYKIEIIPQKRNKRPIPKQFKIRIDTLKHNKEIEEFNQWIDENIKDFVWNNNHQLVHINNIF